MSLARRLLAGLLLAGFGIALGFGTLEAAVRMLHLVPARFWEPHPLLGTWHVAGKTGWWTQEEHEFRVPVAINSHGLRDVEHTFEKPPGVTRVLLLGDSYVEALQVPLEATIARQLEERLDEWGGGRRFEVVGMGVSGYGTASELLYYRETGRRYAPDVVVLAFYPGNDVRNNSPTLEPVLPPVYGADGGLERVAGQKEGARKGPRRRRGLLARSQAYQYFRKQILTRNPAVAELLADTGLVKRAALREVPKVDGVPVDYWVYAKHVPEDWERAWRHTEDLLSALRHEVERDGAQLALLVVTARDDLYRDSWRRVLATYPAMADVEWDLGGPERRIVGWCRSQDLPCLWLSPIFRSHLEDGERLHFVYDGHWTAAGHALAARSLAEFLYREKLIPQ